MQNPLKERLRRGEVALGHFVMEFASPNLPRIVAAAGAEFLVLDAEHSRFGWTELAALIGATRASGLPCIVRVNTVEYESIARTLDLGAHGLMLPRVESAEQVASALRWMKYAPEGQRGTAFNIAHDDFRPGDPVAKARASNAATMLMVQVETVACLESLDEILSLDGADVAWVGHFDLSFSMGLPGQFDHPRFQAAMDRVAEVCARRGRAAARLVTGVEEALHWIGRGYRCLSYGQDIGLYQNALRSGLAAVRQQLGSR